MRIGEDWNPDIDTEFPPLPQGYHQCPMPSGVQPTSEPQATDDPWWMQAIYQDPSDGTVYYRFQHDNGSEFWACPMGTDGPTGTKANKKRNDVRTIQASLKAQGLDYDPGGIDGLEGPKTCSAAYRYQMQVLGIDAPALGTAFFEGLGLPPDFVQQYGSLCAPWYEPSESKPSEPKPDPGPGPIVNPEPPPAPVAAGFDWTKALILALGSATGAIIGVASGDKYAPSSSRAATGIMGALAGLVGGFAINKYAVGDMAGLNQPQTGIPARFRRRWG